MCTNALTYRHGMTLLEISAVMVIGALLAASVIPAMSRTDNARRGTGVAEAARVMTYARERAIASGRPVGVRINPDQSSLELLTVIPGQAPAPLASPLGEATPVLLLDVRFGVKISKVDIPAGVLSADALVLWFDFAGVPHARTTGGALAGPTVADTHIIFDHGARIVVSAISGLVEAGPP